MQNFSIQKKCMCRLGLSCVGWDVITKKMHVLCICYTCIIHISSKSSDSFIHFKSPENCNSEFAAYSFSALMQLCDLLKSRVECPDFLEKLECAQASVPHGIAGMHPEMVSFNVFSCYINNFLLKHSFRI